MVTLTVPQSSKAVALFQHVSIKRFAGGEPVLPILWSDNDITLWPGESLTLTARFATPVAAKPVVPAGDSPTGDSLTDRSVALANRSVASRSVAVESRTP
jgi:exo-1,4-beta-D-glucosaminidase